VSENSKSQITAFILKILLKETFLLAGKPLLVQNISKQKNNFINRKIIKLCLQENNWYQIKLNLF